LYLPFNALNMKYLPRDIIDQRSVTDCDKQYPHHGFDTKLHLVTFLKYIVGQAYRWEDVCLVGREDIISPVSPEHNEGMVQKCFNYLIS